MDGLPDRTLFNAMFEEDKDAQCFKLMPGVPELLERLVPVLAQLPC